MKTAYLEINWIEDGVRQTSSRTIQAGEKITISETIPGGSNNIVVACAFDKDKVKGYQFHCQDRDMTLKFNSSSVPAPQVNLKAGQMEAWHDELSTPSLFEANVTTLFVTLASGADATLEGTIMVDPT